VYEIGKNAWGTAIFRGKINLTVAKHVKLASNPSASPKVLLGRDPDNRIGLSRRHHRTVPPSSYPLFEVVDLDGRVLAVMLLPEAQAGTV
jgi:hypothetical protein